MKKVILPLIAGAVLAAGVWLWQTRYSGAPSDTLTLYGTVDYRQVALAFESSGRITSVLVEEGDRVKVGDPIATLDSRTLVFQRDQAQAELTVATATVERLHNGSRPEEIKQAEGQVAIAEAAAKRAAQDLSRVLRLHRTGTAAVSQQDVDHARTTAASAQAQLATQQAALTLVRQGPRQEDIAIAQAQEQSAVARLGLLQHSLDQATLTAPSPGVIRARLLEPGDMATPQTPVVSLTVDAPKWIRLYAAETDLGRIAPGQQASIKTDGVPDQPLTGTVGYISSVAEFTPKAVQTEDLRTSLVYEVRVVAQDPTNVLRLGQPVTVSLQPKTTQAGAEK